MCRRGCRTLFDQRSRAADWTHEVRPEGELPKAANQSHPLRQTVRHSLSLRPEIRECILLSGVCLALSRTFPDRLAALRPEQGGG